MTPGSTIVVLDRANRILAVHSNTPAHGLQTIPILTPIGQSGSEHLRVLAEWPAGDAPGAHIVEAAGEWFVFARHVFAIAPGAEFRIGAFAPMRDFAEPIAAARNQVIYVMLAFLALVVPLAAVGARRVARGLVALARDSERIKELDFSAAVARPRSIAARLAVVEKKRSVP